MLVQHSSPIVAASALGPTFDFYVSPTGDDNNPGTLASPWSITALNNNRSSYRSKRVGLLPGTYQHGTVGGVQSTIFSLMDNAGGQSQQACALGIEGGTASVPTYVGSSDSSGHYSPRTATISALNPGTGLPPCNGLNQFAGGIIGQGSAAINVNNPVSFPGNVVLDGVIVTGGFGAGIHFYPQNVGGGPGGATGIVCKNSVIHDIAGFENGNMGGLFIYTCTGAVFRNLLIYNIVPTTGNTSDQDCGGVQTQECLNCVFEYITVYNANVCHYDKNTTAGSTIRYCYYENMGTFPNFVFLDGGGGSSLTTQTMYNCILVGTGILWGVNANGVPSANAWVVSNNTLSTTTSFSNVGMFFPNPKITWYNNLAVAQADGAPNAVFAFDTGAIQLADYNAYQGNVSGSLYGQVTPGNQNPSTTFTLAQAQTNGWDTHGLGFALGTMFSSYTKLVNGGTSAQFQSVPASVNTLGRVGGVSSGAVIGSGAWNGTDVSYYNGRTIQQVGYNAAVNM